MKTRITQHLLAIAFFLVSFWAQAQDPATAGINPDVASINVGASTLVRSTFFNGSSTAIPQINNATWTINLPRNIRLLTYTFEDPTVTNFITVTVTDYDAAEGTIITLVSNRGDFPGNGAYEIVLNVEGVVSTGGLNATMTINAASIPPVATNVANNDNSSGSIVVAEAPTPVSLVSFTAKGVGNNAQLDWATAQEKNNALFEVQYSTNGQDFEAVGSVMGKGTTTVRQTYSFVHPGLNPALTHYYRLKQIDTDGSFALSQVRSVKLDQYVGIQLKASTDPARNVRVLVDYGDEQLSNLATIHLMDLSGRTLSSKQIELEKGFNRVNFSASSLSSGLYLIRLENASQPAAVKVALP
ncbi:T9SS type A sorting domain-containing protein [Siphonobacter curvatus]|uniref:Secretion system C-terminal sorting domain-containing protein n=1 Tax=Siphonobacter curvatus TaxID=2094562 RepID=A0A2S7ILD7_9BACT|nr:T9SS type A sorting domain-containing protein [Siphonobacter curvatus]PQA58563.1 hypothetical protein C5O19_02525 [Siphonobacter curvatus]